MNATPQTLSPGRIDWVDYAKGICIILVVMMHSTLGVEKVMGEANWMNAFIAWAAPFRMPDFFLISGLFLASRIDKPWRSYLDSKVVHFAYFYVLWLTIQFAMKSNGYVADMGVDGTIKHYFMSFVEPASTLWFIHMLAIFFLVTRVTQIIPQLTIWLMAAFAEVSDVQTGVFVVDEFCSRFVYFYTGYVAAPHVFQFAEKVSRQSMLTLFGSLYLWAVVNGLMVSYGYSTMPILSLALGFAGVGAVIAVSQVLAQEKLMHWVRYCGENSIVIYLAFFAFMAASRIVLIKTGIIADGGTISLIVTAAGVIGPLVMYWMVRNTPARFLFERPNMFRLKPKSAAVQGQIIAAE